MIVANELRWALSSWGDRLIALAGVVAVLVALSSALSHRPFMFAATAVAALAAGVGAGAARMIERRVDFHSEDGALAVDALVEQARRHYAVSIHAWVCGIVTMCAVIGRPAAAVFAPIGYLIGAGVCHVVCRVVPTGASARRSSPLRNIRRMLQRPIAGALAATLVVLPLLLLRSIEPTPMVAFTVLVGAVALLLTMLDYQVIRFMTECGYSAERIIGIHARSLVTFFVVTVGASLVLADRLVSIVISGVVLAALAFMTIRILAYRIHSKRTADTLVSICVGVVSLTAAALPMLLPVVVIAILWRLQHRARSATWLLT